MTAYQNRRKTFCFVVSILFPPSESSLSGSGFPLDHAVVPRPERKLRQAYHHQE